MFRRKFIISFFILTWVFLPGLAFAQSDYTARDNRCWVRENCVAAVQKYFNISAEKAQESFYTGTDSVKACGFVNRDPSQEVGFCSALSEAKTAMYFGGRNTFQNIGDFIKFIYKYGVTMVAILAVVSIIGAGFKITLSSAGNPEKIQEGKKQLGRSVMGFFLAIMSYVILYTINPYLVNFRVPQTWLINPASYQVDFCRNLTTVKTDNFALVGEASRPISEAQAVELAKQKKMSDYDLKFNIEDKKSKEFFSCGKQFLNSSNPGIMCHGDYCPGENQICIQDISKSDEPYVCRQGAIWGEVLNSELFALTANWDRDRYNLLGDIEIYGVCTAGDNMGKIFTVGNSTKIEGSESAKYYYILGVTPKKIKSAYETCGSEANLGGYILYISIDEIGSIFGLLDLDPFREKHYIGINPNSPAEVVDLGEDSDSFSRLIISGEDHVFRGKAVNYLVPRDKLIGYRLNIDVNNVNDNDYLNWYPL